MMKRYRLLLLALILALGFSTVLYAATQSTTLQVAAIVQSTVDVNTTILSFGTVVDPALGNHTADAFITVTMPAQQPYTITLNSGSFSWIDGVTRHMFNHGVGAIPYKLFQPDLTTEWGDNGFENTYSGGSPLQAIGTGSAQSHRVHGVTQPLPDPVGSGAYTDSVQVTVHF
jgi:spore coat protein U-like protein